MYHASGVVEGEGKEKERKGKGGLGKKGGEGKTGEEERGRLYLLLSTTRFAFDVATVIFPPCVWIQPESSFRITATRGEKILNQCFRRLLKAGLAFDAATSGRE